MRYLILLAVAVVGFGWYYFTFQYKDLQAGEIARGNPEVLREIAIKGDPQTRLRAAGHLIATMNDADRKAGIKLLEELAAENESHALQQLGMIYLSGLPPLSADPSRALDYLTRAAKAGNEPARGTLVVIYEYGKYGISADPVKAEEWKKQPAEGH